MVQTPTKASISRGEEVKKITKFSISYIRVSTKRQTNAEASGIKRQEEEYQRWLCQHPEYKNLDGVEFRDLGVSGRGKNSESGDIGIGMFDFITGELRGLNQVEDSSFALGMDIEEVRKDQVIRDEHFKKVSLEVGRDIRFPKAS